MGAALGCRIDVGAVSATAARLNTCARLSGFGDIAKLGHGLRVEPAELFERAGAETRGVLVSARAGRMAFDAKNDRRRRFATRVHPNLACATRRKSVSWPSECGLGIVG